MNYHLAHINIAKMKASSMDDPLMDDFRNGIARINLLAEQSDGFIWRLKEDDTSEVYPPYNDPLIIATVSLWRDLESLKNFTYHTAHSEY